MCLKGHAPICTFVSMEVCDIILLGKLLKLLKLLKNFWKLLKNEKTYWQFTTGYDNIYKLSRETSLESTVAHEWQQIRIKKLLTNADKHVILDKLFRTNTIRWNRKIKKFLTSWTRCDNLLKLSRTTTKQRTLIIEQ